MSSRISGYKLTVHSIRPTTVTNSGNIGLAINFSLSGMGLSLPGFSIALYTQAVGGSLVKQLYYSDIDNLNSGDATYVSFSNVNPGTYYVEVYYRATGTPRKEIIVNAAQSKVNNLSLNNSKVSSNLLNGSKVVSEVLNGTKIYES